MPKKQNPLTPEEQRKRFEEEVRKQEADGNLDRADADAALDAFVKKSRNAPDG
jgi:hypothetical protein